MITNERQYKITKAQIAKFSDALSRFNEIDLARQGIDPMIIGAQRASLSSSFPTSAPTSRSTRSCARARSSDYQSPTWLGWERN